MNDVIALRRGLDHLMGPARRIRFFKMLLESAGSRFIVAHGQTEEEATRLAFALHDLTFTAWHEQAEEYPHQWNVWVQL